jgi:lantibiotic biosynthesis protein
VTGAWRPILTGSRAEEALAVARAVGERLRDPGRLAAGIAAAPTQTALPAIVEWWPMSLAQGHAGLAVLFAQLDAAFPGEGWAGDAHGQLRVAVEAVRRERHAPSGLFSGLAGLAFAAAFVDRHRYGRLLGTLDGLVAARAGRLAAGLQGRSGCAPAELDVVSGLAGIGAYALFRDDGAILPAVVERLVELLSSDADPPAWHTPPDLLDDSLAPFFPDGCLNCGLAHGMPGPLALLALAAPASAVVAESAAWLAGRAAEDEWGLGWPAGVSLDGSASAPTRTAWCYGSPGVARALWLAGEHELAVAALDAVFRRSPAERRIDAPTFCHGRAGLLQVALRVAHDSGNERLTRAAAELAAELVADFDEAATFGYRDLDPDGKPVDLPGVLQGAAGTALVLLAAAAPVEPAWDRVFLLS